MTSKTFNFLINTENYDTLSGLVKQLEEQIKNNEDVLGRIANLTDHKLRFPLFTPQKPTHLQEQSQNGSRNGTIQTEELVTVDPAASSSKDDEGDELRHYLDSKYKLNLMKEEDQRFSDVENKKLRQLLSDHAKLQKILDAKRQMNGELLQIYRQYDQLLREVILPRLAEDISRGNIEQIQRIKKNDVEAKLRGEKRLWDKYHEYVSVLEKVKTVNRGLLQVLQGFLNREEVKRLEAQFHILEELVAHLRNGKLERRRGPVLLEEEM